MADDLRRAAKQEAERKRKATDDLVAAAVQATTEGRAISDRLRQAIRNYNERLTGRVEDDRDR